MLNYQRVLFKHCLNQAEAQTDQYCTRSESVVLSPAYSPDVYNLMYLGTSHAQAQIHLNVPEGATPKDTVLTLDGCIAHYS